MNVISKNPIVMRTLFQLDPITLLTTAVMNMIVSNHRIRHHRFALISAEIHRLSRRSRFIEIVEMIPSDKKITRIPRVRCDPLSTGMMQMAAIEPNMVTIMEANQR